jgi:hypothetical protein
MLPLGAAGGTAELLVCSDGDDNRTLSEEGEAPRRKVAGRSRKVGSVVSVEIEPGDTRFTVEEASPRATTSEAITVIPMTTAATVSAFLLRRLATGCVEAKPD